MAHGPDQRTDDAADNISLGDPGQRMGTDIFSDFPFQSLQGLQFLCFQLLYSRFFGKNALGYRNFLLFLHTEEKEAGTYKGCSS